jgi:23S rRNA C2498 (ribose-2'-O)-methylase RlmM
MGHGNLPKVRQSSQRSLASQRKSNELQPQDPIIEVVEADVKDCFFGKSSTSGNYSHILILPELEHPDKNPPHLCVLLVEPVAQNQM